MNDDSSRDQAVPDVEADDLELPDEHADDVRGGKPPAPPGPQPIPYPN